MEKIRIKYFTDKIEKLTYIDGKSDWIDLRASEAVSYTHLDVYKRQLLELHIIESEDELMTLQEMEDRSMSMEQE